MVLTDVRFHQKNETVNNEGYLEKEGLRGVILEGAVVALRRILGCPQYIEMSSSTMVGKAERVIDFGCWKI